MKNNKSVKSITLFIHWNKAYCQTDHSASTTEERNKLIPFLEWYFTLNITRCCSKPSSFKYVKRHLMTSLAPKEDLHSKVKKIQKASMSQPAQQTSIPVPGILRWAVSVSLPVFPHSSHGLTLIQSSIILSSLHKRQWLPSQPASKNTASRAQHCTAQHSKWDPRFEQEELFTT